MNGFFKTRWYQFSLRTLLAVVTFLAIVSGWYGYRLRLVEQERSRLAGKWHLRWDNQPLLIDSKQPFIDVSEEGVDLLVPRGGIGWIDFQLAEGGISRGIYRCEGNTITVAQGDSNQPRPTSFENINGVSVWTGVRKPLPSVGP